MLIERIAVGDAPPFAPIETSPGPAEMEKFAQMLGAAKAPIMLQRRQPVVAEPRATSSPALRKNMRCRSPPRSAAAICSTRHIPVTPAILASVPIRNFWRASKPPIS